MLEANNFHPIMHFEFDEIPKKKKNINKYNNPVRTDKPEALRTLLLQTIIIHKNHRFSNMFQNIFHLFQKCKIKKKITQTSFKE